VLTDHDAVNVSAQGQFEVISWKAARYDGSG
jgi:hypothetical protein